MKINPVNNPAINESHNSARGATERTATQVTLQGSQGFPLSIIDALSVHIALLDDAGTIIAVNTAWRRFAAAHSCHGAAYSVGTNFVQLCEAASRAGAELARGIRAVLANRRDQFAMEYACAAPPDQRWFMVRVTRFAGDEPAQVMVACENITVRRRAQEAEQQYAERLKILRKIDLDILAARSPEQIANTALRHIRQLVACQRLSVSLFDFDAQEVLVIDADTGRGNNLEPGTRFSMPAFENYGDMLETLRQGRPYDLDLFSLPQPQAITEPALAGDVRYFTFVPLIVQDELIGSCQMGTIDRPGFDRVRLDILREVADSMAVAIHYARMDEQVRAARERLEALSHQLVELQEAERRYIARELHDEIGQALTGLKLVLEMSARAPPAQARSSLGQALALVDDLMARVRDIALELRPAMLDDLGLLPALLWLFERYGVQSNIDVAFQHTALEGRFRPEVETAAYRIIQEALTNIARHAGVREVAVGVWANQATLNLQVEDRGSGFDVAAALSAGTSTGLSGMHERAMLLGGRVTVESASGAGTRLRAELPLGEPKQ